jgi:prepilin-type N-terminal cleavage/methylation domain-containing protein
MRKPERHGLTMLEVLIALVILGIIATLFGQSSWIAQKSSGKSVDWVQEGIVIEKTIENLRIGHTLSGLQTLDSTWTDQTGQYSVLMTAKGSAPLAAECPGYPVSNLARIAICARRTSAHDSIAVTTFLWVP